MLKVKTKTPKKIELEDLARMMARGFGELRDDVDKKFELLSDDNRLIRADIQDIKNTLGPLVLMMGINDNEMKKFNLRLMRLEKKVFAG